MSCPSTSPTPPVGSCYPPPTSCPAWGVMPRSPAACARSRALCQRRAAVSARMAELKPWEVESKGWLNREDRREPGACKELDI